MEIFNTLTDEYAYENDFNTQARKLILPLIMNAKPKDRNDLENSIKIKLKKLKKIKQKSSKKLQKIFLLKN